MNLHWLACSKCGDDVEASITACSVICDYCVQRMVGAPELPKPIIALSLDEKIARKETRKANKKERQENQKARVERQHAREIKRLDKERAKDDKIRLKKEALRQIEEEKLAKKNKKFKKKLVHDPNKKGQGWHLKKKFEFQGKYYSKGKEITLAKYNKLG